MSRFQRAQMYSLQDPNIHNLAVQGPESRALMKELPRAAAPLSRTNERREIM